MRSLTEYDPDLLRNNMPGFIGGKEIAEKATDHQLQRLAQLNDKSAELHNRLKSIEETINNIKESILS